MTELQKAFVAWLKVPAESKWEVFANLALEQALEDPEAVLRASNMEQAHALLSIALHREASCRVNDARWLVHNMLRGGTAQELADYCLKEALAPIGATR